MNYAGEIYHMRNIFIVDDCEFLRMTLSVISTTRSHITMPIMNDFGAIQAIKPIMDV